MKIVIDLKGFFSYSLTTFVVAKEWFKGVARYHESTF